MLEQREGYRRWTERAGQAGDAPPASPWPPAQWPPPAPEPAESPQSAPDWPRTDEPVADRPLPAPPAQWPAPLGGYPASPPPPLDHPLDRTLDRPPAASARRTASRDVPAVPIRARHRAEDRTRRRTPVPGASRWHWLLLVPIIVPLLTPLYNRMEPELFGIPFFYWCQLTFVGLSAVTAMVVHRLTSERR